MKILMATKFRRSTPEEVPVANADDSQIPAPNKNFIRTHCSVSSLRRRRRRHRPSVRALPCGSKTRISSLTNQGITQLRKYFTRE